MNFPTSQFLGFFLLIFTVYWLLPRHRWRLVWLLVASCAFYMSWNPWLITLIALSASVDFVVALQLHKVETLWKRRLLLFGSISFNLSLLAFFKYTNFLLGNAYSIFHLFGVDYHWPLLHLALPLGISFYTFETISYVVDVYQGKIEPERSLLDYALYIMFFPHLAAGPIVRPRDFLPQLRRLKRFDWYRIQVGLVIFFVGMFKKAVIADQLAPVADPVFAGPGSYATQAVWLATLAYTLQIYCDFSGYSDMAMGLAHMLGFKLPVNFNMPYFSTNITEFWRRWHISLSSWLRDYLYIPLGGNRGGPFATYRNLMLTMLLGGLWHGASWTFVFWGLYHGLLLSLHRLWSVISRQQAEGRRQEAEGRSEATSDSQFSGIRTRLFTAFNVAVTFLSVCIGWVFFRAQTFSDAGIMLLRMVRPCAGLQLDLGSSVLIWACLALVFVAHVCGTSFSWRKIERRLPAPVLGGALAALLLLALLLMPEDAKGFIYFQF